MGGLTLAAAPNMSAAALGSLANSLMPSTMLWAASSLACTSVTTMTLPGATVTSTASSGTPRSVASLWRYASSSNVSTVASTVAEKTIVASTGGEEGDGGGGGGGGVGGGGGGGVGGGGAGGGWAATAAADWAGAAAGGGTGPGGL